MVGHCLDVFVRHLSFSRHKGTICYTKKRKKFIVQGNLVSLVSPKILSLGKAKEKGAHFLQNLNDFLKKLT